MVPRNQVLLFLELMKTTARRQFVFVGREKNLTTLANLGINRKHAESLVLGLKPEDYVSGPETDHNNPSLDVWVFGLEVSGCEIYVKLQLLLDPECCVCVSFHEPERPMHYPLRES
ncbi:MAG: toxin [Thermoleophilia bacterium]